MKMKFCHYHYEKANHPKFYDKACELLEKAKKCAFTSQNEVDIFVYEVKKALEAKGIRCEVDDRSEKIGYKIREAQLQKINYMFVVGDKEVEEKTVSVRKRGEGDIGSMALSDIIARLNEEIATKAIN